MLSQFYPSYFSINRFVATQALGHMMYGYVPIWAHDLCNLLHEYYTVIYIYTGVSLRARDRRLSPAVKEDFEKNLRPQKGSLQP